jgi:Kef-type K+ transport system membrane component KefB
MLKTFHAQEFEFSALLVAALAYALLAEALGMHFIIGAFFAGLFFIRSTVDKEVYERIREGLNTFTHGLFGPIFFASIGLHLDLRAATDIPLMVILLIAIAFMGKLAGAGLPALWSGFSRREALGIGVGMSARGAVELVIADIALRAGLFAQPDPPPPVVAYLFSAVVIMALTTTLVAPLLLRRLL